MTEREQFLAATVQGLYLRGIRVSAKTLELLQPFLAQLTQSPYQLADSGSGLYGVGVRADLASLIASQQLYKNKAVILPFEAVELPAGMADQLGYLVDFLPFQNEQRLLYFAVTLSALLAVHQDSGRVQWSEVTTAIKRHRLLRDDLKAPERLPTYRVIAAILADRFTFYWYEERKLT